MKRPEVPCHGCAFRHATCHTCCEKYKKFVADNTAWVQEKHDKLRKADDVDALERTRTKRIRTILRKRQKGN